MAYNGLTTADDPRSRCHYCEQIHTDSWQQQRQVLFHKVNHNI